MHFCAAQTSPHAVNSFFRKEIIPDAPRPQRAISVLCPNKKYDIISLKATGLPDKIVLTLYAARKSLSVRGWRSCEKACRI
jgi:hypothetical protein